MDLNVLFPLPDKIVTSSTSSTSKQTRRQITQNNKTGIVGITIQGRKTRAYSVFVQFKGKKYPAKTFPLISGWKDAVKYYCQCKQLNYKNIIKQYPKSL